MKVIRVIGLCLAALFAFSAVAASSASATDLLFKPASGGFPYLALALNSIESKLETTNGSTISCEVIHVEVTITDAHLGFVHVLWLGCKESVFSSACHSPGQASGRILLLALFHLGLGHRGTELKVPAVLVLVPAGFEIECAVKITVKGSVIGEIKIPTKTLEENVPIIFKQVAAGKQDMTEFLLSKLTNEELMTGQKLESHILANEESGEKAEATLMNPSKIKLELEEK